MDDARACAQQLVGQGLKRVIITLGDKGALLATSDTSELIPGCAVQTRDTTGAGDAFIGSFAVFLAEGIGERDAIGRANLYAALSTTAVGAQKSFVSRRPVRRRMEPSIVLSLNRFRVSFVGFVPFVAITKTRIGLTPIPGCPKVWLAPDSQPGGKGEEPHETLGHRVCRRIPVLQRCR